MNGNRNLTKAFGSKRVRRKKIYSVLSSRNRDNSNVRHFEGIPVEILPNMLHSVWKYSKYHAICSTPPQSDSDVPPLSVVFEICRNWEESLAVFEALSSCG